VSRVNRRQRSPVGALAVVGVVSILAVVPFMLNATTPIDAFFYLATFGADLIIVAYLLTSIAALVWSIRRGRTGAARIVGLLAAIAVMAYIIKGTVYPIPQAPFNLCMYAAGITIAAGLLLLIVPRLRASLSRSPLFAITPAD
jgi:L-asparagine transporter-like permease